MKIPEQFNLVTDPWIKVITNNNQINEISLETLFGNSNEYRCLANDTPTQDTVILRFLLAILTTVYTMVDAQDEPYDWINLDLDQGGLTGFIDDEDEYKENDLLDTWQDLYETQTFSPAVIKYLKVHQNEFNFITKPDQNFGYAFNQMSGYKYNKYAFKQAFEPDKNGHSKFATSGQLSFKQLNRLISESTNKPTIFKAKNGSNKNDLSIPELVRWLLTYQQYAGAGDKGKTKEAKAKSVPVEAGWMYRSNIVYTIGKNLFETLMLNLILIYPDNQPHQPEPTWAYTGESLVKYTHAIQVPEDFANLYTHWSRMFYITWTDINNNPIKDTKDLKIFVTGLPKLDNANAFIEPMTTWKYDKKENVYIPQQHYGNNTPQAMWRNFGSYIKTRKDESIHQPYLIDWLEKLEDYGCLPDNQKITLQSSNLLSKIGDTSQAPVLSINDNLSIDHNILLDPSTSNWWLPQIEDEILLTQNIVKSYRGFAMTISKLQGNKNDDYALSNKLGQQAYDTLNQPFKNWLISLQATDDRSQKSLAWNKTLEKIILNQANQVMGTLTTREMKGKVIETKKGPKLQNCFTAYNSLTYKIKNQLYPQKEG